MGRIYASVTLTSSYTKQDTSLARQKVLEVDIGIDNRAIIFVWHEVHMLI